MRLKLLAKLAWDALQGLIDRNGVELSGYIAFATLLALFPFVIFVVSVAGFLGDSRTGQDTLDLLALYAPADVLNTLTPAIQEVTKNRSSGLLTLGLVFALYSAASGISGFRLALNQSYCAQETRSFWRRKAEDFLIVIVGSVVLILISAALVVGPWLSTEAGGFGLVGPADRAWWPVARYAGGLTLLFVCVVALHRLLPDTRLTIRRIIPGALTSTILWTVAAAALTFYFNRFANYSLTYGSLGGVIVTLMFFYVSAIVFIYGGEINGILLARRRSRTQTAQEAKSSKSRK
jgi:membrane protein